MPRDTKRWANAMELHLESKYPNRLAYVLKLRNDATPDALAGRLENLVTGRRLEFGSGPELLEAIVGEIDPGADRPLVE